MKNKNHCFFSSKGRPMYGPCRYPDEEMAMLLAHMRYQQGKGGQK